MPETEAPADERTDSDERKALAAIPERNGMHLGTPAYKGYSTEMVKLIKGSIMPAEATDVDLYYLLEMAATYKLDPFAKEIWAVKMPGKNAGKSGVVIMVGRDGLLAIAERNPDYRGFRVQSYYANDTVEFDTDPREMPDGTFSHFRHSFSINDDRGALRGAWAEVYRAGRPTVWFDAKLEEYLKGGEYSPWSKQTTVMIEKCALATALRHTYRISGLYLADEMSNAALDKVSQESVDVPPNAGMNLGEDEAVAQWLLALFAALAKEKPQEYLPGKQRLLLAPLDAEGRMALAERLQTELYEATGELVAMPDGSVEQDVETVSEADTEIVS